MSGIFPFQKADMGAARQRAGRQAAISSASKPSIRIRPYRVDPSGANGAPVARHCGMAVLSAAAVGRRPCHRLAVPSTDVRVRVASRSFRRLDRRTEQPEPNHGHGPRLRNRAAAGAPRRLHAVGSWSRRPLLERFLAVRSASLHWSAICRPEDSIAVQSMPAPSPTKWQPALRLVSSRRWSAGVRSALSLLRCRYSHLFNSCLRVLAAHALRICGPC